MGPFMNAIRYSPPRCLAKISSSSSQSLASGFRAGSHANQSRRLPVFRDSVAYVREPVFSSICHCATCRRASAAPTVGWLTCGRRQVDMLSGQPPIYRYSQGVVRRFCGTCGSQLSYESEESPTTIDITAASMDNPALFPPTLQVWL